MIGMLIDRPPGGIFLLGIEHSSGFSYTTTLSRPAQFSSFLVGVRQNSIQARNKTSKD
jgi:hypothetical protein